MRFRFPRHRAVALLAFLPLAAAGCAYGTPTPQSRVQQVGQTLLGAYEATATLPAVQAQVSQSVRSGVDLLADANGSYDLWFKRHVGQATFTVQSVEGSAYMTVLRSGNSFYSTTSHDKPAEHQVASSSLAKSRIDLNSAGREDSSQLPQIQSPGMDPFQVATLLGSLQWPDSIRSLGPVAVSDASGQHIEYQVTVDTSNLARHESGPDREWLRAMAREPHGKLVTLEIMLADGRIATASVNFPLPPPKLPAVQPGKRSIGVKVNSPIQATVAVTATFEYGRKVPTITIPLGIFAVTVFLKPTRGLGLLENSTLRNPEPCACPSAAAAGIAAEPVGHILPVPDRGTLLDGLLTPQTAPSPGPRRGQSCSRNRFGAAPNLTMAC